MLRSFDYAARTALDRAAPTQAPALLEATLALWRQEASRTFLESYAASVADSGLYGDWTAALQLLERFLLEKACYELRYELDHRPEWVRLPVGSLLAAIEGG